MVEYACERCGEPARQRRSMYEQAEHHYCDDACYKAARAERKQVLRGAPVLCGREECENKVQLQPGAKKAYCSPACQRLDTTLKPPDSLPTGFCRSLWRGCRAFLEADDARSREDCACWLGISGGYLHELLTGARSPSPELYARLKKNIPDLKQPDTTLTPKEKQRATIRDRVAAGTWHGSSPEGLDKVAKAREARRKAGGVPGRAMTDEAEKARVEKLMAPRLIPDPADPTGERMIIRPDDPSVAGLKANAAKLEGRIQRSISHLFRKERKPSPEQRSAAHEQGAQRLSVSKRRFAGVARRTYNKKGITRGGGRPVDTLLERVIPPLIEKGWIDRDIALHVAKEAGEVLADEDAIKRAEAAVKEWRHYRRDFRRNGK